MSKLTGWIGWVWFAAILLLIIGLISFIGGIFAIFSPGTFVSVTGGEVVFWDVSSWGWGHLILGALVAVTGLTLMFGSSWVRMLAVVLIVLNAIAQFVVITVLPWQALLVIALDVVVLWAIIVHGDETKEA